MRRSQAKPRKIVPDEVYGSVLVSKLINRSMLDGKKSVAQKQIYTAFAEIEKKTKKNPVSVFEKALANIKPDMEVRSRRVGGAAYQVPVPVRPRRQESLALRWLVEAARSRPNKDYHSYSKKLAAEIIDAANGEGAAVKKRAEVEHMAEANKAFAHFRW